MPVTQVTALATPAVDADELTRPPAPEAVHLTHPETGGDPALRAGPEVASEAVAAASGWEDLAARRAGAMAREQATALQQAAPVRTFLTRLLGVHTDERAWRIGADGEAKVAARLDKTCAKDPRWRYVNAVPVGNRGSDIDHVVMGPGGVYTLNAKHHPGARIWVGHDSLRVNGHHQPYLRNSRYEATRAARLLTTACGFDVTATGVIVLVGIDELTIKTAPDDVHVLGVRDLPRWLAARTPLLDEDTLTAIYEAARRSTTWL